MNQQLDPLFDGVAYSYHEYIHTYVDLLNHPLFSSIYYLDEETSSLQDQLKEYFIALPDYLTPHSTAKEDLITALLTLREQLEVKYRTLVAYQRELTALLTHKQYDASFLEEYLEMIGLSDVPLDDIHLDQIMKDCTSYIFDRTSGTDKQKRAASLLSYIPIKMTQANYATYVEKSIRHIAIKDDATSASYLTALLKQIFNGENYTEYGKHFKDIALSLEQLHTMSASVDLFEEADLLNETIDGSIEILEKMFRLVCTLSNLLIVENLEFNDLTSMHASFFDLYHSVKNILLGQEDTSLMLSTLTERIKTIQEELTASYAKAKQQAKPDSLFSFMDTYLHMNIHQIFGFTTAKHSAYSHEVLEIFSEFTTNLQAQLKALPQLERKLRMQYFMAQIPFIMNEQTFSAYIHQAFTNLSQVAPNLLVASQLTGILEEGGFFPTSDTPVMDYEEDEEDEASRFLAAFSNPLD